MRFGKWSTTNASRITDGLFPFAYHTGAFSNASIVQTVDIAVLKTRESRLSGGFVVRFMKHNNGDLSEIDRATDHNVKSRGG